jgi:hypothetical protein
MAGAPGIPQNPIIQSANQQILISWDLSTGATAYNVERSEDNITYTALVTLTGTPLATSYVDTTAALATQYWYRVNASSTTGSISFTGQPNVNDTVSINNVVYTAVASGATGLQFNIGATTAQTISNLSQLVNSTIPGEIGASPTATQLLLTALSSNTQLSSALTNTTVTAFTSGGTSSFTTPLSAVATPAGEMCLSQIRLQAMQRADRVNSNFLTKSEWNRNINQAMFELYDLLITTYEDYYLATPVSFNTDGSTFQFPLPNGSNTFINGINNAVFTPKPYYKLRGVDLAINNATNAYVTINKFNFSDRNTYVYPNTSSTIYGVFNMQYRVMGSNIEFIPTPQAGQQIRLWYIPRMTELLLDTDTTDQGVSGWIEYVIVRAAKYALDKEESDSSRLTEEIQFLKQRIEETAANRDAGLPDKISNTRGSNGNGYGWGDGNGGFGPIGGF